MIVKKSDGSNRVCVDYRKLNKLIVFDLEPMPTAEELFQKTVLNSFSCFKFIFCYSYVCVFLVGVFLYDCGLVNNSFWKALAVEGACILFEGKSGGGGDLYFIF